MKKILALILAAIMALSMISFASAEQGAKITVGLANDPGNIGPFQGMSGGRIGILFTTYEMLMAKDADTSHLQQKEHIHHILIIMIRMSLLDLMLR